MHVKLLVECMWIKKQEPLSLLAKKCVRQRQKEDLGSEIWEILIKFFSKNKLGACCMNRALCYQEFWEQGTMEKRDFRMHDQDLDLLMRSRVYYMGKSYSIEVWLNQLGMALPQEYGIRSGLWMDILDGMSTNTLSLIWISWSQTWFHQKDHGTNNYSRICSMTQSMKWCHRLKHFYSFMHIIVHFSNINIYFSFYRSDLGKQPEHLLTITVGYAMRTLITIGI